MNDSELNELLQHARVPERSAEAWNELASDTMRQVGRGVLTVPERDVTAGSGAVRTPRPTIRPWAWAVGFATACVLIGFILGHWQAGRNNARNELAEARKLFAELSAMFPNQLEAIVLNGSTPRLVLAEKPMANRGAPLFVRICRGNGCQRVITYSGQRVMLNGENCEVLVDARGQVIVTGDHFAWSSGDGASVPGGYRIEAALLAGAL